MSTVALIPAHDEAARIAATVTATRAVPGIDRVVVVDDGSTDRTPHLAREAGAEVIQLGRNRGKGAALQAGLNTVATEADVIVLLDADLGDTAAEAQHLLAPLADGSADMTVAIFPAPTARAGFGLVLGLARWGIRALSGFEPTAPLSGQRALTREAWRAGTPFAAGFGVEVALSVRVQRAGLRIAEVPVAMAHAPTGRNLAGFAHRGLQFLAVSRALAMLALERYSSIRSDG